MPGIDITVVGNLGAAPELKTTGGGTLLATFALASTERRKNDDGQWVDGPTSWIRCCAWDALAERIAACLGKGDRVIVHGTLRQRDYEHKGEQRTSWEVTVADAAPSIKFNPAKVAQDP